MMALLLKIFMILVSLMSLGAEQPSEQSPEADESLKPAIYDLFGRKLTQISLSFGGNYTHERFVETERMHLRYFGPKSVFLKGEVGNCTIGTYHVPNSDVTVKLEGKDILPVKTRIKDFRLHVEMANPHGRSGAIQCGHIRLLVD